MLLLTAGTAVTASVLVTPTSAGRAAAAPARVTIVATLAQLGTLGGTNSSAADMDGNLVVGTSTTGSGAEHAFAYDRSTRVMRDLGTLGGPSSTAVAVDGAVVVGNSKTASGETHAFAYDLTAPSPTMRDLGTLGGPGSSAVDVANGIVAGSSNVGPFSSHAFAYDLAGSTMRDLGTMSYFDFTTASAIDGGIVVGKAGNSAGGEEHAFAYDLASPSGMRDLGSLGFDFSQALDVDGSLVVGNSLTSTYRHGDTGQHGFAYDLRSASGMRDVGDLGYDWSQAWLVAGTRVVGVSQRSADGPRHLFAYDAAASSPRMRDLGNLGGDYVVPRALTGNLLVGRAARAGDQQARGFVYDFGAAAPMLTDLGPLGGTLASTKGDLVAVQGDTVAGTVTSSAGTPRATLWTLHRNTGPAFRFTRLHYLVGEKARRAMVTVQRAGSPSSAVSVRYSTRGLTAKAGRDFKAVSGVLRFGAGQTRKSFSVPILDDAAMEKTETTLLTLRSPSSGTVLGTPNAATLDIRASDQRPDAWVSIRPTDRYAGNNVYNATGARQTKTQAARRSGTRTFYVRVYNDGNAKNTLTIRSSRPRAGSVRFDTGRQGYRDWTRNVTTAMRSSAGWRVTLGPHRYQRIRMQLTAARSAPIGSRQVAAVTATWRGDMTRVDQTRSVVRVVR